ncbi:MAG: efflux RND transporter periplasmic adaptor subunit [Alistipes sp.]|nr:efflux RND transporter periplasmic adaptor subunit [Alistipes sp.]MDE6857159.1 efflux RND transporter periplasmic adaptor subunit [Alistipes sp.]
MKKSAMILAAALLVSACGGKGKNGPATEEVAQERILTRTETAAAANVVLSEVFTSEIEPYKENDITPAAQGVHIDRILVDVGSRVKQGQLLATLDPTQYNQQLLQLRNLEADYDRLLPVYEAGGISKQQIDQQKTALDVQREVVANLRRNIEILSPLTGVVTARNYDPGDLFSAQPILHVMQIDPLKVIVNISEQYFPAVREGMKVAIAVDIFPDAAFTGRVALIHPALDATTRTFTVEVEVPNADRRLRPGMFARTTFDMGEKQGVLVPDVAVQKQVGSAERYLYVIEDGRAVRRSVKVGRQVGSSLDILSGVEPGEQVAVTALSRLYDGAPVEIKE